MVERLYCDLTESPFGDWYEPVDGYLALPQGPGLGIEPDRSHSRQTDASIDASRRGHNENSTGQNQSRPPAAGRAAGRRAAACPACCANSSPCRCMTDDGIEGIGVTTFGGKIVRTLKAALEDFGELINGDDPLRTEQMTAKLRAASAPCGPAASRRWRFRRSTSRCGISAAKPSAFRWRGCSAACATACRPMPAAR